MQDSPNVSSDPDNLWAPRTVAFFAIVILANLVVDLAAITGYAFARVEATGGLSTRYVSGFLEGILIGLFATQIVALAIWTANFPGSSTARWLAGTLVMFVGSIAVSVPMGGVSAFVLYQLHGGVDFNLWNLWASALANAAWTLLLFYIAQVPFWIERRVLGLRITRDPLVSIPHNQPLRIVDLFGVVAFVAIAMALARVAGLEDSGIQLGLTIATVSILMFTPGNAYLFAAFWIGSWTLKVLAYLALSQLFAWSFAAFIFYVEQGQRGGMPAWRFMVLICQGVGLGIVALAIANGAAAYAYGYHLIMFPIWRRGTPAELPAATSSPAGASPRP